MLGRIPHAINRSAYNGAKHFLGALTANFRTELEASHPGIAVSLVSPGVVYTEFGKHAVHGGPDSRKLAGGQEVGDTAEVILGVIESRRPDVYTFPGAHDRVVQYFKGLGQDP
jgi:short-subunit dehydrogenase